MALNAPAVRFEKHIRADRGVLFRHPVGLEDIDHKIIHQFPRNIGPVLCHFIPPAVHAPVAHVLLLSVTFSISKKLPAGILFSIITKILFMLFTILLFRILLFTILLFTILLFRSPLRILLQDNVKENRAQACGNDSGSAEDIADP